MINRTLDGSCMPWPTSWAEVFGREAPLLVEIGFGSGHALINLAHKRPDLNVLGVEIHLPGLRRVEQKLEQSPLPNLRLVQATAEQMLWAFCRPESVDGLIINFPDPWPKADHNHRRLINAHFLHLAATRMKPGAPLDLATDHVEYARVVNERLQSSPYFESRLDAPFVNEDNDRLRTKYEQKALADGRICYYFKWRRNEVAAPDEFPIPQELPMPHIVLSTPLTLDEIAHRFEQSQWMAGTTNVRFTHLYRSVKKESLLVDTYVNEEATPQQLAIVIRPRGPGELLLNVHTLGFPRPTIGVHYAVHFLADWLISLGEGSTILSHDLHVNENRS